MAEIGNVGENIFNSFTTPQPATPVDRIAFIQALEQHATKDNLFSNNKSDGQAHNQKKTYQNFETKQPDITNKKPVDEAQAQNNELISKPAIESTAQETSYTEEITPAAETENINTPTSEQLMPDLEQLEISMPEVIDIDTKKFVDAQHIKDFSSAPLESETNTVEVNLNDTLNCIASEAQDILTQTQSFFAQSSDSESEESIDTNVELDNNINFAQAAPIQALQEQQIVIDPENDAILPQEPAANDFEKAEVIIQTDSKSENDNVEIPARNFETKDQDVPNKELTQMLEVVEPEPLAQVAETAVEQSTKQSATISAKLKDSNDNKAKSTAEQINVSKAQKPELSIVESVKVTEISTSKNMPSEMSFEFSQNSDFPEIQSFEEKLEELNVGSKPEFSKTSNTQSIDSSEISTSVETKSAVEQIKEAASTAAAMNAKKISIVLTPKNLGSVEIELGVKAGNINSVDIKVEKAETLAMFIAKENSAELEAILKGVNAGDNASLSFSLKEGNHGASQDRENTDLNKFNGSNDSKSDDSEKTARSISSPNQKAQQANILYL